MALSIKYNRYYDAIINPLWLPDTPEELIAMIKEHLIDWEYTNTNGIWLEIPTHKAHFIPQLYEFGFKNHHCTEDYIMLKLWINAAMEDKLPIYGTHIVRCEAILLRTTSEGSRECCMVIEKYSKRKDDFSLLSGSVKPDEYAEHAIVREVKEEVGLNAICISLLGIGNRTTTKCGRNEIFFIYHLELVDDANTPIKLQTDELKEAKWVNVDVCIGQWHKYSKLRSIQRDSLIAAVNNRGLKSTMYKDSNYSTQNTLQYSVRCKLRHNNPRNNNVVKKTSPPSILGKSPLVFDEFM